MKSNLEELQKILNQNLAVVSRLIEVQKWLDHAKENVYYAPKGYFSKSEIYKDDVKVMVIEE